MKAKKVGIVLAVIAITLGLTASPAWAVGRIKNATPYYFTGVMFNEGPDEADCTVWNGVNGGSTRSPYTFTHCDQWNIAPKSTTSLFDDFDAFRPSFSYPGIYYYVRFRGGSWVTPVHYTEYTRIRTVQLAHCYMSGSNIECDIRG